MIAKLEQFTKQLLEKDNYGYHEILESMRTLLPESIEQLASSDLGKWIKEHLPKERFELWEKLVMIALQTPYSSSYYRRSYRSPSNVKNYANTLLNLLLALTNSKKIDLHAAFSSNGKLVYVDGEFYYLDEQEKPLIERDLFPFMVALKLNEQDPQIEEAVREILWKNGAHPFYSQALIKGILMSNRTDFYQLVGDVLLAAKNQEGARQVIVETIDQGTLEAQRYFMELIVAEDLGRFSSVVRAVDVWFGLGYEAKDKKQIYYVLTESLKAFEDSAHGETLLSSESSLDVFIGIWVLASQDVENFFARIDELMQQEKHIQQTTLYALLNTELQKVGKYVYPYLLTTNELHTFLFGFRLIVNHIPTRYFARNEDLEEAIQRYFDERPWLLEHAEQWLSQIENFFEKVQSDKYEIEGKPFPFLTLVFEKQQFYELRNLLLVMLGKQEHLTELAQHVPTWPVEARDHFYFYVSRLAKRYDLLLPALQDRSVDIRTDAIEQLALAKYPLEKFKTLVPKLLTLKTGEVRQAVNALLASQPIAEIETLATELLKSKKEPVRLGMLELLITVRDDLTQDFTQLIATPTEKEQQLLEQLDKPEETFMTQPLPPIHEVSAVDKNVIFTFKQFVQYDFSKLIEKLASLEALIKKYEDVSYQTESYWGDVKEELIGESLSTDASKPETIGSIDHLPLSEIWTEWLVNCDLTDEELCVFHYLSKISSSYFLGALSGKGKQFIHAYFGDRNPAVFISTLKERLYSDQVETILNYALAQGTAPLQQQLKERFKSVNYVQFCSSMLMDFHATEKNEYGMTDYIGEYEDTTISIYLFQAAFFEMGIYAKTAQQLRQLIYTTSLFYEEDVEAFKFFSIEGLIRAFDYGLIDERHVKRLLLTDTFNNFLRYDKESLKYYENLPKFNEVRAITHEVISFIVEQELKRGEVETPVTEFVSDVNEVDGSLYFIPLLKALGEEKLSRNWMYNVHTRKESLSLLLQKVSITNVEKSTFFAQLDDANFEAKRLIEVMFYNTELIPLLSEYIGWAGLEQAAWYFVAHTTESTNDYEVAKINEYSAIAVEDFERGSFDRKWFLEAHNAMDAKQFEVVYASAKYSAAGANHRRAQLYARATLGELEAETLRNEIDEKRNQDKLRAYSLLPITKKEAKERYLYFQSFLKQSKQYGAQRRASEALAVEMAIQNLAEQVADGNVTQFMWQMENERFIELQQYFTPQLFDEIELQLVQEEAGKVVLNVKKSGKPLKSVPKKIAKDEQVLAIQEARKELMEQYKRARVQLERAMCEETFFESDIIHMLVQNSTFEQLLVQLVWRQDNNFYALKNGSFITIEGEVVNVKGHVQVAHPYHLREASVWREWQQYAFDAKWQQPFKQLFRELYLVSEDEKEKAKTNRFEGYQIQPNKAVALLKSRGWKTGYDEPVRKISYHYNTVTVIDFVYDYFTASDVEAPTLQEIMFVERLTRKPILLQDVPPVHFSEVLRDLDLVVSVAHAGEVDPEASHSTIEMRAAIVEEMVRLFQLENVEIKAPHVLIKGELARYSIHLGSGNVHQLGGAMIPVIAVPSQHRGRVFLPFIDEDPKTAEISAKVLLFADDATINDPQIRAAINS